MVRVNNYLLRIATFLALVLIYFALTFFTNLSQNVIVSIAIILIFLILFTFIFENNSPNLLKVCIILFTFLVLPIFVLFYMGVFNAISRPWGIVLAIFIALIFGILAIVTMNKLQYVEVEYLGD